MKVVSSSGLPLTAVLIILALRWHPANYSINYSAVRHFLPFLFDMRYCLNQS